MVSRFSKSFVSLLCVLGIASTSSANEFAGYLGAKLNGGSAGNSSSSVSGKTGYQAGVSAYFDLAPEFGIRSGLGYMQRNFKYTTSGTDFDLNYSYFEVPVGIYFKAGDMINLFGGIALSQRTSQEGKGPTGPLSFSKDAASSLMPIQLGASVKFGNGFGAEFYYESISGDLHENIVKSANSVNLNLAYFFD